MKVFGCTAFLHVYDPNLSKLDPRAHKCAFLGYSATPKGYLCYSLAKRKYFTSRDVTFFETKSFFTKNYPQGESTSEETFWETPTHSNKNQNLGQNLNDLWEYFWEASPPNSSLESPPNPPNSAPESPPSPALESLPSMPNSAPDSPPNLGKSAAYAPPHSPKSAALETPQNLPKSPPATEFELPTNLHGPQNLPTSRSAKNLSHSSIDSGQAKKNSTRGLNLPSPIPIPQNSHSSPSSSPAKKKLPSQNVQRDMPENPIFPKKLPIFLSQVNPNLLCPQKQQ